MYLKSLTLKGFKSFPDRTTLTFAPGVSVVVGPNGCGKSNITDAVLWALGEQSPSAVRGQSMQDVIFAGGKGQGRRRFAEVEVVIDNSEGRAQTELSEISITRRLERTGEGTYRLNGARCRLVDVLEVLSDTNMGREMHSVISQGKVEEIVHSKPRDRRLLIEEAAGLGKHRKRRHRAQLKLDRTRDNLDRALDVEREARRRLAPLKRQAQAADLHARLERQGLELRGRLVADRLREDEAALSATQAAAAAARKARDEVEGRFDAVRKRRQKAERGFAARDEQRRKLWASLSALRGGQERLGVRAEALASLRDRAAAEAQGSPGAVPAAETGANEEAGAASLEDEAGRIESGLGRAGEGLARLRGAEGDPIRLEALAAIREGAEVAAAAAGRAERRLGDGAPAPRAQGVTARALAGIADRAAAALSAMETTVGERQAGLEAEIAADEDGGEAIQAELRECSREEYELQRELLERSQALTEADVGAAQAADRRKEAKEELDRIDSTLELEVPVPDAPLAAAEREEIERALERLEGRRARLGPVNPLAEREYEEARTEAAELEERRQDLERAIAELDKLIGDTDRAIHEEFERTLDATARNFTELIEHLFPGGRGELRRVTMPGPRAVLGGEDGAADGEPDAEDEAEPELGVEIEVTPAGKATKRLSLLSGGEKSLVALAFVFAVFLARPCPFYILDEVEAALDDSNIDRFLQLVRRYAARTQFVIVTHQKRTMDAADVLYGVSMGTDGVTKVVSRRLPREQDPEGEDSEALAA
jgi:chromosome segregation ATPase